MLLRILLKLLLASLLLSSCGKQNEEYVDTVLRNADSLLKTNADSALVLLSTLKTNDLGRSQKANLYLLESDAKYRSHVDIVSDTSNLTESIAYFAEVKDYSKLFHAYLARCRAYFDAKYIVGDADKAMLDCMEARRCAETLNDNSLLSTIYQEIGDIYYAKNQIEEALSNFKKAHEYLKLENDLQELVFVYGRIGSAHSVLKQYDSALLYQNRAIEIMIKSDYDVESNRYVFGLLLKNTGNIYRLLKNYQQSKRALLDAYKLIPEKSETDRRAVITLLCDVYIALNQPDSAIYYAQQFPEGEDKSIHSKAFMAIHWYRLYKGIGNTSLALQNLETYIKLSEAIREEEASVSVMEIQKKYDKELIENQYNQMLVQRLYLTIMFIVGVLIGSLLIWSLIYRMKRKENELLKAQQSLDVVRRMLSTKESELATFRDKEVREEEIAGSLAQKDEKLRELLLAKLDIARRIAQMNVVSTDNSAQFMKQYRKIFGHDLMDEIGWTNISSVIDELYNSFSAKIESKYPQLSEKDMQLCCLIRAGFKSDEISVLMNYTQNTVRVKKSRLGQKMGFADYDSFLSHILAL